MSTTAQGDEKGTHPEEDEHAVVSQIGVVEDTKVGPLCVMAVLLVNTEANTSHGHLRLTVVTEVVLKFGVPVVRAVCLRSTHSLWGPLELSSLDVTRPTAPPQLGLAHTVTQHSPHLLVSTGMVINLVNSVLL